MNLATHALANAQQTVAQGDVDRRDGTAIGCDVVLGDDRLVHEDGLGLLVGHGLGVLGNLRGSQLVFAPVVAGKGLVLLGRRQRAAVEGVVPGAVRGGLAGHLHGDLAGHFVGHAVPGRRLAGGRFGRSIGSGIGHLLGGLGRASGQAQGAQGTSSRDKAAARELGFGRCFLLHGSSFLLGCLPLWTAGRRPRRY